MLTSCLNHLLLIQSCFFFSPMFEEQKAAQLLLLSMCIKSDESDYVSPARTIKSSRRCFWGELFAKNTPQKCLCWWGITPQELV